MTNFVEGDTAFTVATVGFVMVPEPCSYGSAEDFDGEPCSNLAGFLIGVDCVEDEENNQSVFVVCAEHLPHHLIVLADERMERERQYAETLSQTWGFRQGFLDMEVDRLDGEPAATDEFTPDFDCAHCGGLSSLSVLGVCRDCNKCIDTQCCPV